jgi:hypothetical protein
MKLTHLFIVAFYLVAFCYVASGERNELEDIFQSNDTLNGTDTNSTVDEIDPFAVTNETFANLNYTAVQLKKSFIRLSFADNLGVNIGFICGFAGLNILCSVLLVVLLKVINKKAQEAQIKNKNEELERKKQAERKAQTVTGKRIRKY